MSNPRFHGGAASFSASRTLEALGESLAAIRREENLTWADLGRVLGKSEDRAASYAGGAGDMGIVSFMLGAREWNGRFANDALALIGMKLVPLDIAEASDRRCATSLTKLLLEMSAALEDGSIDDRELAGMKASVEAAGQAIDRMRERLAVRAA